MKTQKRHAISGFLERLIYIFNNISITRRLILYFSLLLVLQMMIIGWFSYSWVSNYLKELYVINMRGINDSVSQQINSVRTYYEELSDRILANTILQNLLVKNIDANSGIHIVEDETILCNQLYDPTDTIYAIILQPNGKLHQPGSGKYIGTNFDRIILTKAYQKSLESNGRNLWISVNENMMTGKPEPFLYECRTLNSLEYKMRALGQLVIQIPLEKLSDTFSKINIETGEYYEILDNDGNYLYSTSDINVIGKRVNDDFLAALGKKTEGVMMMRKGKEDFLVSYSIKHENDWNVVHVLPMKVITSNAEKVRDYLLLIMFLSLMGLLPLLSVLSGSISRPVRRLKSIVEEFGAGNLAVREKTNRTDEIGHLQVSFNKMAEDINSLLDKITEEHKQRRLMELNILEYQINPHFLYNSLDSVNWMAKASGNKDIEDLVCALAKFLRVGLSKGKELYKVKDELEHVRQYLVINKIRFKDCFNYEIQADDDVLEYSTVKIILQPIVENAIKYSINKRRTDGFISVTAQKEEHTLMFQVSDNGPGIQKERLQAIHNILADHTQMDTEPESGFGLYNVNQRIWLHFGDGYGITLESDAAYGTTVQVRLPLRLQP